MDRSSSTLWIIAAVGVLGIGLLAVAAGLLVTPGEPVAPGPAPEARPLPEEPRTIPVPPPRHETAHSEPLLPTPEEPAAARKPLTLEPTSDGSVRLEGRLRDEISGRPVTLFKIWCVPTRQGPILEYARLHPTHGVRRRAIGGRFVLPYLKPTTYNLLVEAAGYKDYVLENLVIPHEGKLELLMSRGAHIEGRVIDMSGQPVPDIQVYLNHKEIFDNRPPPRVRLRPTDRTGHYLFSKLPPGRYTLSATSPTTNETPEFVIQEDQRLERDIILTIRNALRITVTDSTGRPLPNSMIRLYVLGTSRSASTDYNGQAEIRYLPAKDYSLKVSLRGYQPHREQVSVQNYGTQDIRVMLEPLRKRG